MGHRCTYCGDPVPRAGKCGHCRTKTEKKPVLSSGHIVSLLQQKHADQVFVAECKNGSTWMGSHRRLDAWVMLKSWQNASIIGYEIKVSRSDFMGDRKWPEYLPMCNELYFAAPHGLIKPDELPPECGLIEATPGGKRMIVRKKAPHRKDEIDPDVFRYILMHRAKITNETGPERDVEYWRRWLARKSDDAEVGFQVRLRLASEQRDRLKQIENRERLLVEREQRLAESAEVLNRAGIEWERGRWHVSNQLKQMSAVVPPEFKMELQHFVGSANRLSKIIEEAEKHESVARG